MPQKLISDDANFQYSNLEFVGCFLILRNEQTQTTNIVFMCSGKKARGIMS